MASMTISKPLGIGRGVRASHSSPPAPVPTATTISAPRKINGEVFHENREFLRDIVRKLQSDNKLAPPEVIKAEFEKRTGFPLKRVAVALGFRTEDELFESMDLIEFAQSQNPGLRRNQHNLVGASVSRVRPTNLVGQPAKISSKSSKGTRPSRHGSLPPQNSRAGAGR